MRIPFWIVVGVAVLLLGSPDTVFAWGPAMHVGLAATILDNLGLVPAGVAVVLARHGASYLYGNIAADVVVAKRLSRVKQFCHHWSTAFGLLEAGADDRSRAFAYGYLSHLAADTVAHGKFVPRQIILSECSIHFGHLHWELRADAIEKDAHWCLLERLLKMDHEEHHQALERHITDTFLPYKLNRLMFGGLNALAVRQQFRRTVDAWNRFSRWYLSPHLIDHYRAECVDRMLSLLSEGPRSAWVCEDPNGTSALMQLRVRRREVRRLKRRGVVVRGRLCETSRGFDPQIQAQPWVAAASCGGP